MPGSRCTVDGEAPCADRRDSVDHDAGQQGGGHSGGHGGGNSGQQGEGAQHIADLWCRERPVRPERDSAPVGFSGAVLTPLPRATQRRRAGPRSARVV